jgi:phosphoribosylanthranilate isomerase
VKPTLRVKICCIASRLEANAAIAGGASALGLVSAMPSGPGIMSEEKIAEIARGVPPPIGTFLLTSSTSADAIIAQQKRCATNTIQLCDYVATEVYRELRRELPGIALV